MGSSSRAGGVEGSPGGEGGTGEEGGAGHGENGCWIASQEVCPWEDE